MFEKLQGRNPVLFWSGGLDSTLLLAMLREQPHPFDIVQIRDFWTKAQLKRADELIIKWNLQVFSYPASSVSFIGQGDEITAVFEYAAGTAKVPMLRDVIPGDRCIADLNTPRMHTMPMSWDLFLIGSRKDDTHYAIENLIPSESWERGGIEFYAPLFEMSRADVVAELKARGLEANDVTDETDTGNIALCTNCLNGTDVFCPKEQRIIPPVQWDRDANTRLFRESYA